MSGQRNWVVYIVECADGTYYTGATNNLEKRLICHNSGRGAKYTKNRLPIKLIAYCDNLTKSEAMSLEYHIKKQKSCKKVEYMYRYRDKKKGVVAIPPIGYCR